MPIVNFSAPSRSQRMFSHSFRSALLASFILASPNTANAVEEFYTIDSTQSWIELDSTSAVQLQFFGLVSQVAIPLVSQVGSGGTGAVLPDGSTSDGRRTAIDGHLLIDVTDSSTRMLEITNRRTRIGLVESGTWLPGLPQDPATAAPAELAAQFESVPFLFDGMAAVREVEFSIGHLGFSQAMTDQGGGTYTFPFGFSPTGGPPLSPFPVDGVWEFETNLIGTPIAGGRGRFLSRSTDQPFFNVATGTFVEEPAGGKQVTIPIDGAIFIGQDSFGLGAPLLLRLELRGQIVAATPTFVPEPGAGPSALTALGALVTLARRRRKYGSLTNKQLLRRLTLAVLIVAPIMINCIPLNQIIVVAVTTVEPFVECTAGEAGEETTAEYDGGVFLDRVDGLTACGEAASGQGTEGAVTIEGEASVQSGFIQLASEQAKFELSCATRIAGGQPSLPTSCTTRVTQVITHSGSATDGTLTFGASQLSFGAGANTPATASVRVDCGVGPPVDLTVNGSMEAVPVEDVDFTCTVLATLDGGTDAEGETVQTLNVVGMVTPDQCETHEDCRQNSPASPYCVTGVGCTGGSIGSSCAHDSQCDADQDLYCGSSLMCLDGGEGEACITTSDCAMGLICRLNGCTANPPS